MVGQKKVQTVPYRDPPPRANMCLVDGGLFWGETSHPLGCMGFRADFPRRKGRHAHDAKMGGFSGKSRRYVSVDASREKISNYINMMPLLKGNWSEGCVVCCLAWYKATAVTAETASLKRG